MLLPLVGTGASTFPAEHAAFQVLGADFVVDSSGQPWLLELNAAPQFGDPLAMSSLRQKLGLPLLMHLPSVILRSRSEAGPASGPSKGRSSTCGGWERLDLEPPTAEMCEPQAEL